MAFRGSGGTLTTSDEVLQHERVMGSEMGLTEEEDDDQE
jgi:hypothetical protein